MESVDAKVIHQGHRIACHLIHADLGVQRRGAARGPIVRADHRKAVRQHRRKPGEGRAVAQHPGKQQQRRAITFDFIVIGNVIQGQIRH